MHVPLLELAWAACPPGRDSPDAYPDCLGPYSPRDLTLRILPDVVSGYALQDDVFACALIAPEGESSRQADIIFGRLKNFAWKKVRRWLASPVRPGACLSPMLGAVVTHEVGHLLLGSNAHSKEGIIRANWGPQALEDAYEGQFGFTPKQVKRLEAAVRARSEAEQRSFASLLAAP